MQPEVVPDEIIVRRTIAERSRELRLLRSIERALARYRREQSQAEAIREATDAPQTADDRQGAGMPDLILRDTDPDDLRAAIVADVLNALRPMLERRAATPKRIATRAEMAEILGWSVAKLDRRTAEKAIPSMLDGDRRSFVIDDVIEAIKAGTEAAEAEAAKRQTEKQAKRRSGKGGAK